jgi:hypothetical protein
MSRYEGKIQVYVGTDRKAVLERRAAALGISVSTLVSDFLFDERLAVWCTRPSLLGWLAFRLRRP